MSRNFKSIEYNDVKIGDYIKISIHFDIQPSSNHIFYKPIDFHVLLNKYNIIVIKKRNIKELKRYTVETRQKTIDALVKLINKVHIEFEQLLNTK
jgi:hypothetical protein